MKRLDSGALWAIFVILSILDAFTTQCLIFSCGWDVEANPIIHWSLYASGTSLILYFWKLIILLLVGFVTRLVHSTKYESFWRRVLLFSDVAMLGVVLYSIRGIFLVSC